MSAVAASPPEFTMDGVPSHFYRPATPAETVAVDCGARDCPLQRATAGMKVAGILRFRAARSSLAFLSSGSMAGGGWPGRRTFAAGSGEHLQRRREQGFDIRTTHSQCLEPFAIDAAHLPEQAPLRSL
jgi:hypothetical protein